MKKDIKKLKKKVHKLKDKQASENQSDAGELQLSGLNLKKYNLKNDVKGMFNAQQALNYGLREFFSLEEIRNSSISGKKIDGPRPPLDQKFRLLEEIIHEKFPSFTRKEFREKIQNIQEVERKKFASNSQL